MDGRAVAVQQALQPGPRRRSRPSAEPPRSRNGHGGRTSTRSSRRPRHSYRAARRDARGASRNVRAQSRRIRCTSTRNELLETISPIVPFLRRRRRDGRAAPPRDARPPSRRPATKPVAASAAACDGRHRRGPRTAPAPAGGRSGDGIGRRRPLRSGVSLSGSWLTRRTHSMTASTRPAASTGAPLRRGAEDVVPVRARHAEAALVVLEVVAHVQLAQPPPDGACADGDGARGSGSCRRPGSRPGSRPRTASTRGRRARARTTAPNDERERHGGRRRHDEPQRVVGMVVVDAVDHPVQPGADPVLGLEVEDDAVQPVLRQRPDGVAAQHEAERVPDAGARSTPSSEQDGDDGEVDAGRGRPGGRGSNGPATAT